MPETIFKCRFSENYIISVSFSENYIISEEKKDFNFDYYKFITKLPVMLKITLLVKNLYTL